MADISIDQVTTTDVNENGVFDVLMRSVDSHLDKQYTSGRIKGTEYATVYLGALQTVLQQAIAFVLSEEKTEKEIELLEGQIDLVNQQVLTEKENTILVGEQHRKVAYETDYLLPAQVALINQQTLTETQQTVLVTRQHEKVDYETKYLLPEQVTLLQKQILTEVENTILVTEQHKKVAYETDNLLPSQVALVNQQKLTEEQQTILVIEQHEKVSYETDNLLPSQVGLINSQILTENEQTVLVKEQHEKIAYETDHLLPAQVSLVEEQILTETEQHEKLNYETTSVLPAQVSLIGKQVLTEAEQTILVKEQHEKISYENDNINPRVLAELNKKIDVLTAQETEVLVSTERQNSANNADISLKDAQESKINKEIEEITFKIEEILPSELRKSELEVDRVNAEIYAINANVTNKETLTTKQVAIYEKQASAITWDAKQKLLNSMLNIKAAGYSSGNRGVIIAELGNITKNISTDISAGLGVTDIYSDEVITTT